MAASYDFFIIGEHDQARGAYGRVIESQGYTITSTPTGGLLIKRGSTTMTVLFGGLAGRRFQLTFTSEFFVDDQGVLVARLNRSMAGGALKGGALGATKTENAFVELVNVITSELSTNGMLRNRVVL